MDYTVELKCEIRRTPLSINPASKATKENWNAEKQMP
jgi:hypothetical protein